MRESSFNVRTTTDRALDWFNTILLAIVCILIVYPLYYVLVASFTEPSIVSSGRMLLYPEVLFMDGYERILKYQPIWAGYRNTIIYTVVGVGTSLVMTIPAAYAMSRPDLGGRKTIHVLFTITMFFSGGLIPTFLLLRSLNMYNTIWAVIMPGAISVFNLIVCRTFFEGNLPLELLDAARVDGCSDFRFFFMIALPLSSTIIAVMALFYGTRLWNDYMNSLMFLLDESKMPLQVELRNLIIVNTAGSSVFTDPAELAVRNKLAAQLKFGIIVVSAAPLLIVYPFLQKYFAVGVTVGAIKG